MKRTLSFKASLRAGLLVAMACVAGGLSAAATDIGTSPLFTASAVKPNIMFIMDDSKSMERQYLPEAFFEINKTGYGFRSTQCNALAYDPGYEYKAPPDAVGNVTDAAIPTGELYYYKYKGAQPKQSWRYNTDGTVSSANSGNPVTPSWDTNRMFYYQCNSDIGGSAGKDVFDKVLVVGSTERQNYANWLQYYSTRRDLAKTAIKRVFIDLDNGYRVGFSTISKKDTVDETGAATPKWGFLNIADFGDAHKGKFFSAVNAASGEGHTPLRGAFAKAGQYFAKKAPGQTVDPVQLSCQRNFAILATDGGWTGNAQGGETIGSSSTDNYGPYKVDNATLISASQDSSQAPPMKDDEAGTVPSLADVTDYYYRTDLRDDLLSNCTGALGMNVCRNNVPQSATPTFTDPYLSFGDSATHQHVTSIIVGLGLAGELDYRTDYRTDKTTGPSKTSGDFPAIVAGTRKWPNTFNLSKNDYALPLAHVDDMWHAAVNGRGQFFSARDPQSLVDSLGAALSDIKGATGSASAAATSSMQPVAGDNDVFVAKFKTQEWTGDVLAYSLDPDNGSVSSTARWSAQERLESKGPGERNIYYKSKDTNTLVAFNLENLTADTYAAYFSGFCSKPGAAGGSTPSQCAGLGAAALPPANEAANLIQYLRGDKTMTYYRHREKRLGDVINAAPLYVGAPRFPYGEASYQTWRALPAVAGRKKVVLVGANDGMLHAFDQANGNELWAYIPTFVLPNLYKLADTGFRNKHSYFVDGSPQMGDIKVTTGSGETATTDWKTIVVGGLNGGGRGYYALDVTNPASPSVRWEFKTDTLGLTFGNPIITKRKFGADEKWVVVFTSGYNNVSPGDGIGRLFVLDAWDGTVLQTVSTDVGTTADPSGLSKINAWVDSEGNNKALRFYGGDLLGNLWRFDIDDLVPPTGTEAKLLAKLTAADGTAQPVTTKPALAEVRYNGGKLPMVYVATGRYLGLTDLPSTQRQTVYAIKEPLSDTGYDVVRTSGRFTPQVITGSVDASGSPTRAVGNVAVDLGSKAGWYADFPVDSERVTVNPVMALDTLYVASNLPNPNTCDAGGVSFLYKFNILTGNSPTVDFQGGVLIQGVTLVELTDGSIDAVLTKSDGTVTNEPGLPPSSSSNLKRSAWRELAD